METIREDLLQFIWENRLFDESGLFAGNEKVEVIETGLRNRASGPDFFNALIKIGSTTWAGNVEIHVRASDWFRHNHQDDRAYFNVILHVVYEQDCRLERPGGEEIPCVVLKFDPELTKNYEELIRNAAAIPCSKKLSSVGGIYRTDWYSKLMTERLQEKTEIVDSVLKENKYDWEDTLYYFLGKSFGFKVNEVPFEALVRSAPLGILQRSRRKALTVNAILFGQAGFLEDLISEDDYYISLQREYHAMLSTLPPRILDKSAWRFMGTRPGNFPLVRIAQFASVVVNQYPIFSKLTDNPGLEFWRKVLSPATESYWEDHYLFGKTGRTRKVRMGRMAAELVILNAFIPVIFHYASQRRRNELKDSVIAILEHLSPEKNDLIRKWEKAAIKPLNSFESQALIHLTTRYCRKSRCLECMIGNRILKGSQG
jgi:hypothetical protein